MSGKNEQLRNALIIYGIIITYVSCFIMGMILVKYKPTILAYTDLTILPVALFSFFFMWLFTFTWEKKITIQLDDVTLKCAELYGKGLSFAKIAEELEIKHHNEVKRRIEEFCKSRC